MLQMALEPTPFKYYRSPVALEVVIPIMVALAEMVVPLPSPVALAAMAPTKVVHILPPALAELAVASPSPAAMAALAELAVWQA